MAQYLCTKCGFVYDEVSACDGVFFEEINGELSEGVIDSQGNDELFTAEVDGKPEQGVIENDEVCVGLEIFPGTKWQDVPDDFRCPRCKAGKDQFRRINP